jgi:hypothetical protein
MTEIKKLVIKASIRSSSEVDITKNKQITQEQLLAALEELKFQMSSDIDKRINSVLSKKMKK